MPSIDSEKILMYLSGGEKCPRCKKDFPSSDVSIMKNGQTWMYCKGCEVWLVQSRNWVRKNGA